MNRLLSIALRLAAALCVAACARAATPAPTADGHWAFRPVVRPSVPSGQYSVISNQLVSALGAARLGDSTPSSLITNYYSLITPLNPIDHFLATAHARSHLTPLPPAARSTLLRRVYIDLIGLPPTREELREFLADTRADAYERVVERLLNSPQHGERWARHWMDVWRYSDWFGRRMVPDVWNSAPQIWRWRDWIVRSLNADHGYDRMIHEMLAGDEVAPLDDTTAVATGFLVRNWYALNPNEWMRANVEHTGKAFLGLTFNCAHCHDHKYDPITQADYFNFRAFFEPLYVRQDRWPGEADPGPFQDYDYSKNRKVQRLGGVRVFDKDAAAKTWFYTGGDERNRQTNRPPASPAMPEFLGGKSIRIAYVALPAAAFYPGAKEFVRDTELKRVDAALADAKQIVSTNKTAFTEARVATAEAERASILARLAADNAKFGERATESASSDTNALARAASKAERQFKLATAKENLAKAESDLDAATKNSAAAKDDKAKADTKTALTKSEAAVTAAKKSVADAEAALAKESADYTAFSPVYPRESTGRRRALAEWITARDNPLTARVAVNHIWMRHFHEPLVASVFDFGRGGSKPTHPELLDWLAAEFMDSGWSMKHLHRLIVTSAAYRRASRDEARSEQYSVNSNQFQNSRLPGASTPLITDYCSLLTSLHRTNQINDPENRSLWRFNTGRMESEVVRDSILHLAGALDPRIGGQELENKDALTSARRSLYYSFNPESDGRSEFSALFDAPDPNECYRRTRSIVPQQALALTNSKLVHDHAPALAKRLGGPTSDNASPNHAAFITAAFEHILSRPPTRDELAACEKFLNRADAARTRESLVRALLNHNDFVTVR